MTITINAPINKTIRTPMKNAARATQVAKATCCGVIAALAMAASAARAHDADHGSDQGVAATARYIANEGVMIEDGDAKILFDPLFHNSFGQYRVPSTEARAAILAGAAPFDGVDAIFISHAHGDHFAADDMNRYLAGNPDARLVAPRQAVAQMRAEDGWREAFAARITAIALDFGDPAQSYDLAGVSVDVVRIPHAGWPGRADVENMLYRVSTSERATVMHMGDADPDDSHYAPYDALWRAKRTDMAFPPYWFYSTADTHRIVTQRLNADQVVGVHVPERTPPGLAAAKTRFGIDYFSIPGESRTIHAPTSGASSADAPHE